MFLFLSLVLVIVGVLSRVLVIVDIRGFLLVLFLFYLLSVFKGNGGLRPPSCLS